MSSNPLELSAQELLQHDRWLRELVRRLAGSSDAEDAVQDTWLAALSRGRGVQRPEAWLTVVATNFIRRRKRSEQRRAEREEAVAHPEATPCTAEALELIELQQQVIGAVRELHEPYRSVVLLRFTQGLSVSEIARRLDVTEACVRQRLKRALDGLRADVGVRCGDDWRSMPALGLWCFPGVLEMKKSIGLALGLVTAVSMGLVASWTLLRPSASETPGTVQEPLPSLPAELDPQPVAAVPAAARRVPAAPSAELAATTLVQETVYSGRVRGPAGQPLGDVPLGLTRVEPGDISSEVYGRPVAEVLTAGDGSFEFSTSEERSWIVPGADWVSIASSGRLLEQQPLELVLARSIEVAGVVRGPDGSPLDGVAVEFVVAELRDYGGVQDSLSFSAWSPTTTDEQGRFRYSNLPAEMGRLRFEKDGYLPAELELGSSGREGVEIGLELVEVECILAGWVLSPGGVPVEGARVGLGERTTRSLAGGAFEIRFPRTSAPSPADALWVAMSPWRTRVIEDFGARLLAEPESYREHELYFEGEAFALGGVVVDAEGKPASGITVYLWNQQTLVDLRSAEELGAPLDHELLNFGPRLRVWAKTDAQGRFSLGSLRDREYRLRLFDREHFAATTTDLVRAGNDQLLLRLPVGFIRASLEGRVLDRGGRGVPNVLVSPSLGVFQFSTSSGASLSNQGRPGRVETDANGYFELSNVSGEGLSLNLSGEAILPKSHFVPDNISSAPLEIRVDVQCHFRLVLTGQRQSAAWIQILDDSDRELMILAASGNIKRMSIKMAIEGGRTRVLSVSGQAATLVLLDESEEEIDSMPLDLTPANINEIHW